jgi:uncharacterized membrane protein
MPAVIAAVTAYNVSIFIHVTAVVIGFGATFAESVMFPVAMRLGKQHLPYVHELQITINRYFAGPALLVIVLTGFYQVSKGNWKMSSFWISGTLLIVIVLGGLVGAYFIPTDKKLAAMSEREAATAGEGEFTPSAEYQALAQREGAIGGLAGLLIVAALFLMITKP